MTLLGLSDAGLCYQLFCYVLCPWREARAVWDCYRQEGILAGCFDSVPSVGMLGRLDSWNFYWFVPVYESQTIPGSLRILATDLGTMSGTPAFTPGRPHSV